MSDRDRLHQLVDTLPAERVHALLILLEPELEIGDAVFADRLAGVPEEDVDEETVARVLAAESESGDSIDHDELRRRLGL